MNSFNPRLPSPARAPAALRRPFLFGATALWILLAAGCGDSHATRGIQRARPDPVAWRDVESLELRVSHVTDGDTLTVTGPDGRRVVVRLLNIDTPEKGEPGFDESRAYVRARCGSRPVSLRVADPSRGPEFDRYGRLLAYVFVEGTNLNVEVVRAGWSDYSTRFGRGRFPQEFAAAAREARTSRRGLFRR